MGAFWRTDHSFAPQITLKNVVETASVQAMAVLYAEDGPPYPLPSVTLPPGGVKTIDIRAAIETSPADVRSHFTDFGSAEINYQWYWGAAVLAQISNIDSPRSLSYMSNFQLPPASAAAAAAAGSGPVNALQGLWWLYNPDVQPFLRVTNTSAQALNPVLSVATSGGASSPP